MARAPASTGCGMATRPTAPAPVEGGFTVDDFTVDEQAGTVTCPNGNIRPISATRVATFGALCRACPLRRRCTKSETGRKIVLHDRDDLAGAENPVRTGQAACSYSWRTPPRRSRRRMLRFVIVFGSVIG